ncbi:hypothetical protein GGTG_02246 [Gaeumannomyces tritici R3-111a-1]|uniref:Dehydrogenase FUB6 n=1 Tax=Gaeumannomyces tritici (strain R3-111a-1) TaxID=644352 RepID=J3NLU6_GAET3|nr:hypothetical protein GGTG_02246 [Gaeumannomyces tritici R3-111a-1]EJT82272.1 hypothetical protein GGTG_02246 [Gaeumannomyces tritici R3-111a-1]
MAKTSNKTLIFKKVPDGFPKPGDIVVEDRPIDLSDCPDGGVVAQVLSVSLDPYLRGRMRAPEAKSYFPPFALDGPVENAAVCRVVTSRSDRLAEGDLVRVSMCAVAQYAALPAARLEGPRVKLDPSLGIDPAHYLGALGMPGLTAFAGLYDIGKPKKGETIFVSSAAGAVGQLVGQLALREGLRVIGSAGSDDKVEFVKSLGFHGAFNYKEEKPDEALARLAPDGIDIYFENVGGEHLEAALNHMNKRGRIPACGMIADYNRASGEQATGIRNLFLVVGKEITMRGFLVNSLAPEYSQKHFEEVSKALRDGSIKAKVHVTDGIERGLEGILAVLQGGNFGKAVLKISD